MAYQAFMKKHQVKNGEHTHTRIPDISSNIFGGTYNIPQSEMATFWQLYYEYVFVNENKEYLTEKQQQKVMAIDLDFRYEHKINHKLHDKNLVDNIIGEYLTLIKKYVSIEPDIHFPVYVFEKPNVNQLKDGSLTKDGIHIIIGLQIDYKIQMEIRKEMILKAPEIFPDTMPFLNNYESIFDDGMSKGSSNFQVIGSRKPNNEAYELTIKYDMVQDPHDGEFCWNEEDVTNYINENTIQEVSVRCDKYPKFKPSITIQAQENPKNTTDTKTIFPRDKYYELVKAFIDKDLFENTFTTQTEWSFIGYQFKVLFEDDDSLFISLTKKHGSDNKNNECIEWYAKFKPKDNDKQKAINTIKKVVREEAQKSNNMDKYDEIIKMFEINFFIKVDDLTDTFQLAIIISKTLKTHLVLCRETWYMLTDNNLWKNQKEPSFYIINEIRKYIDFSNKILVNKIAETTDEELKQKYITQSKGYLNAYKWSSTSSFISVITKYLKTLLADDKFSDKLDTTCDVLAFKNGIFDLRTKSFRNGILSSDFITDTIPYDYSPCDTKKKEYLKAVLKKILNNNEEHLEYYLSLIGYSFIGSPHLEKSIYFMIDKTDNGKGDNGKTFWFDILTCLFPNYVYRTKSSLVEKNNSKIHKQIAMMKGKRLVWLEELPKEKETNAEIMKEIGDGNHLENEVMFGTSEKINILFKMFVLSNHIPNIDPNENAVYNRYKQISFNSHFDRTGTRNEENYEKLLFIADTTLGDKIKNDYYNEVFDLIIEYANKYYQNKIPKIPSQFINDTKETQYKNDTFASWFDDNCVICENSRVPLKKLTLDSGLSEKYVKEGMSRKGFKYDKDLCKLGKDNFNKHYKGGYVGVAFVEKDDCDTDTE